MDLIGIGLPQTEREKPQAVLSILSQFVALFINLEVLGKDLLHARAQPSFTGS